jgi:3-oxoacyl-[acyl-carrier-protein] synthase-1
MNSVPVEIAGCGMVTAVGLSSAASGLAIRLGLANPTRTGFMTGDGEFIMGHAVVLEESRRGTYKLAKMAAMAIEEALQTFQGDVAEVPLLLCLCETTRPGRLDGLEADLLPQVETLSSQRLSRLSQIIPYGRVAAAVALLKARRLLEDEKVPAVLIVATDSLLTWPTLRVFESQGRLLTEDNSNGFLPGEGAAALLVRRPVEGAQLVCTGVGFGHEAAHIASDDPLRGDGLSLAVRNCLRDAGCELHELDFRITDLAGEQYYFKEAALAFGRVLRQRKEEFEMWHPADCIGETGATAGVAGLALARMACIGGYAPGRGILLHSAADAGQRAAIVVFGR